MSTARLNSDRSTGTYFSDYLAANHLDDIGAELDLGLQFSMSDLMHVPPVFMYEHAAAAPKPGPQSQ